MIDEKELVDRYCRTADESAVRQLYRLHTPSLYRLAYRQLGGNVSDAEEVIQEAWIRATRSFATFRWESRLATWLAGILINCCRERIRQRRVVLVELDEAHLAPTAASTTTGLELERAVASLPEGCREILLLHDVAGFTHVEIGQQLGCSDGTSKSQLFEARRRVRRFLSGEVESR